MKPIDQDRNHEKERLKALLKQAIPSVPPDAESGRDLWPAVLKRVDAAPGLARSMGRSIPWFDWALIAGLVVFAALCPATIPVFLYYL